MGPYDALDRQTVAPGGGYSYDAAGNMTQVSVSPYVTTLTFDSAEQAQTSTKMNGSTLVQKLTYQFDFNGNRTQQTDQNNVTTNYAYDQANRMTLYYSSSTGATCTPSTPCRYAYNGDGLRTTKTVSGLANSFVWNLVESSSTPLLDGTTSYVTGFGGLPLEQITSKGTVYYYHQDQLGSTADTSDSHGSLVDSYVYDSYGNVTSPPVTIANPLQFGGQYVDSESGLQYLRARYYESSTGLFLTRDPMAGGQGSPYAYAAGSPQNATDPSGLWPNWQAGWNALASGSKDIGRQGLVMALTATMNWVGQEHDDLASGDPLRVGRGIVGVVGVAAMVVPGLGEADAGAQVLFDTNAIIRFDAAKALLKEGEQGVVAQTSVRELAEVSTREGLSGQLPEGLTVVADDTSITGRAEMMQQLRMFDAKQRGIEGDAAIGATGLARGMTLITGDWDLANAYAKLGGEVRYMR